MPHPNSIEQAQQLWAALTNQATQLSTDAQQVLAALRAGQAQVLVEVPWGEVRDGETHETHQLILKRLEGDRVYFINALKGNEPVGAVIEGRGPRRRVEAGGLESMTVAEFGALFEFGGKGMLR